MTFQYKNILPTITILFVGCNASAATLEMNADAGASTNTKAASQAYAGAGAGAGAGALPGAIGLGTDDLPTAKDQPYAGITEGTACELMSPELPSASTDLSRRSSGISDYPDDATSGTQSAAAHCISAWSNVTRHTSALSLASPSKTGKQPPVLPDSLALARILSDGEELRSLPGVPPAAPYANPSAPTHPIAMAAPVAVTVVPEPRRTFHQPSPRIATPPCSPHPAGADQAPFSHATTGAPLLEGRVKSRSGTPSFSSLALSRSAGAAALMAAAAASGASDGASNSHAAGAPLERAGRSHSGTPSSSATSRSADATSMATAAGSSDASEGGLNLMSPHMRMRIDSMAPFSHAAGAPLERAGRSHSDIPSSSSATSRSADATPMAGAGTGAGAGAVVPAFKVVSASILPHMRTDEGPPHPAHFVSGAYHEAEGHNFP